MRIGAYLRGLSVNGLCRQTQEMMVLTDESRGCRSTCLMAAHPWDIDHREGDKQSIMTLRIATLIRDE